MVSKDEAKSIVVSDTDESDSDTDLAHNLDAHSGPQVRKKNKALQVHFRDICEAQKEHGGKHSRSISCKVTHRQYMTMPARRSIPNVTRSTGVQTSPDLTKRYKTFPFERKKGHTFKHAALVEDYRGQNNGFLSDIKALGEDGQPIGLSSVVGQTKVLLHQTDDSSDTEDLICDANCVDGTSCPDSHLPSRLNNPAEHQDCGTRTKHKGLPREDTDQASAKRLLANSEFAKGGGPVAWNSLTRVESLGSPSKACKRKQSQTLPHSASCSSQSRGQCRTRHASASSKLQQTPGTGEGLPAGTPVGRSSRRVTPQPGDKDIKEQLQAMENLINSSQETIKVLLGVIQELEKGEAQREGLTYRTGQDTANCDTCRNSACIIYSVELDFKLQEDKLQPLMKRLCPLDGQQCPPLPYSNEVFTSTPKRKSKSDSKKHARWKLWFL
ncbi:inhibitory synaptic factor 2A-like isoform X1 [Entelurus aequoreus]|uniref:inhibitory synaptic factor 2A-like isoform X1 n=2 Tax=Entelurus aequoreus TaxID=161455 RepID=UPI002B1D588B|nr:inhibitory synaptic factor 2A-like isoform X1 [Entelurus aequoreus]XP_061913776.1 inhibitory synaptic factor 2A-like isoform X1 [Entelurus aequoreus]XP_061913777.1 inhibitory synaptic factor 2A-like isoform X1 [Entelurus aequoreus]